MKNCLDKKRISIIIPVYNAEKFIDDCINSIESQLTEDMELILVDDGSTDLSADIISRHVKENGCVHYIYQKNMGAPAARNRGLEKAQGEFVLFFDADDIMMPDAISRMTNIAEEQNADMVVGSFQVIDESGRFEYYETIGGKPRTKWDLIECAPNPGSKIFRTEFLEENNIRFTDLKVGQDLNFFLKCMACAETVSVYDGISMKYRQTNGGISRSYSKNIIDICKCFDDVRDFYTQHDLEREYKKYVENEEIHHYAVQVEKTHRFKNREDARWVRKALLKRVVLIRSIRRYKVKRNLDNKYEFFKNFMLDK